MGAGKREDIFEVFNERANTLSHTHKDAFKTVYVTSFIILQM